MPIYEFQCTACKHLFEEFFSKVPARLVAKCPECGAKAKKIISNVGIVFKGSGFYVTDQRSASVKSSSGSSSSKPDKAKTDSKTESSSESKSESSGETKSDGKSGDSKESGKGTSDSGGTTPPSPPPPPKKSDD
ncbi:MAG: zinc ribbon domain-containing protein [bacterium]